MQLSEKTLGQLGSLAAQKSHSELTSLLTRHSLSTGDPGPPKQKMGGPNRQHRASAALSWARENERESDLLDLAAELLNGVYDDQYAPEWSRNLLKSLRDDGFSCSVALEIVSNSPTWGPTRALRWTITAAGYTELPIAPMASDVSALLRSKGLDVAAGHFEQALEGVLSGAWATSNGQLRAALEEVLLQIGQQHLVTPPPNGGRAIQALQDHGVWAKGHDDYAWGIWRIGHTNGSHPGLGDEDEATHRMYATPALITFLVRTYL